MDHGGFGLLRIDFVDNEKRHAVRVFMCFVNNDQRILVSLGGDKHDWENKHKTDWYENYVPAADRIIDVYISRGEEK